LTNRAGALYNATNDMAFEQAGLSAGLRGWFNDAAARRARAGQIRQF
jgi:hypothetical protein